MLIGSPIDSGREDKERARRVLHLAFICELYEPQLHLGRYFLHAHSQSADSWEQSTVVDFINTFPDTFQTVTDRSLFGPDLPHDMNTLTRWFTNSGCVAQGLTSLNHSSTARQTITSAESQQLRSDLGVVGTSVDRCTSHAFFLIHFAHVITLTSWLKVSECAFHSIFMPSMMCA